MEYAVKKILGYHVLAKNKSQFLRNIIPSIVASVFLCIVGIYSHLYSIKVGIGLTVFMCSVEMMILMIEVYIVEKQSINKILKGGCL